MVLLTSKDETEVQKATSIVDDWRQNHLPVLQLLADNLTELFFAKRIDYLFTSQRLKRMTSIFDKLDKKEDMKLGGLNDIGGLRFVFPDISLVNKAIQILVENQIESFELLNDPEKYNYIERPAPSGYRSVHLVFKHNSSDERYDGLRVELQLRTKLQHDWATAVESGEIITGMALKNSEGPDDWLNFFKISSALFSIKEGRAVRPEFLGCDKIALCNKLIAIESNSRCLDLLKAFKAALLSIESKKYNQEYYLLNVDYDKRIVNVTSYSKDEFVIASQEYAKLECGIENQKNAVVLVSAKSLKELRDAYPSYFIDTTEFLNEMDSFLKSHH